MEQFDPQYSPNMSDGGRRYCYIRQPEMAAWNLQQLADALVRARLLSGKQAKAGLRGIRGRGGDGETGKDWGGGVGENTLIEVIIRESHIELCIKTLFIDRPQTTTRPQLIHQSIQSIKPYNTRSL